jgi:MoaA/NifB/PqqE/SkfB family radical SAM enzyme
MMGGEVIMPNIMLTYRCNLKCPYCFASNGVQGVQTRLKRKDRFESK